MTCYLCRTRWLFRRTANAGFISVVLGLVRGYDALDMRLYHLQAIHNLHMSDINSVPFQVYFEPEDVKACIVTCGGLCPGLNTVIRELVCGLSHMYNVSDIFAIQVCAVLHDVKL
jgi:hypothetical protein